MTRDDDDWLDALAGRPAGPGPGARDGARLREALARRRVGGERDAQDPASARQDALVSRAHREAPARQARPWRRTSWLALAASLGVVAVGLLVVTRIEPPGDAPTVRSGEDVMVRVEATDPVAEQQALVAELRGAGVDARGYEMLGRYGVDADLPVPVPPAVRTVLERHRVPPPARGALRVEFGPPAGR